MIRICCLSVLVCAIAAPAFAQAPPGTCKVVFDAMLKGVTTPHHSVTTKDGAATGELIATADAMYVKLRGEWRKSPMTPQAMLAQQQQNIRDTTVATCSALPDDVVDGKPVAVYQTHYEQKDLGASDAKIWIAKATGLPLRTDVSREAGDKVSIVTRFDYDNIKAPVVK
jgi:hypothetical protein